ncbi:MAG: hypothetical protein ACFFBQ_20740 [Promethearchaeota archaeon]
MFHLKQRINSIYVSRNLKVHLVMLLFHASLFITLLIIAFLIFQSDPYNSLWSAGIHYKHANDSWKFIANTMNPIHSPYPYHLIATSLHYLVLYKVFLVFIPSLPAITLSVLIVQFTASLFTVFLLYHLFLEVFQLDIQKSLVLVVLYDFIFLSPFLLLAVSEILFLFYQLVAWTCFIKHRYFYAAIATAMTFALRFNGAFFVIGIVILFCLKWWESKNISLRLLINTSITAIIMLIIGFSSFIISWFGSGDFWIPLTSQQWAYDYYQEFISTNIFSFPFLWWLDYIQWVYFSNSLIEVLYMVLGIIALGLGFLSLYALLKWEESNALGLSYSMAMIYATGFLGINIIVTGSNFARFLCYTFPVFPVFPSLLRKYTFSPLLLLILVILSGFWGIVFNIIWWLSYLI